MKEKEHAQSKTGFLTVIVGPTGSGKTCIAKEMFEDAAKGCVLDINEEYKVKGLHEIFEDDIPEAKFSMHPAYFEVSHFVKVAQMSSNATIMSEESTGYIDVDFFRSKLGQELVKVIAAKRHTQRKTGGGNNYIFIFHSLNAIPPKLWNYIDFLFMFKSVEREIKSSEPAIIAVQEEIEEGKRIPYKTWEISDYRVIVRTNHGKSNLEYIDKFKDKIYDPNN